MTDAQHDSERSKLVAKLETANLNLSHGQDLFAAKHALQAVIEFLARAEIVPASDLKTLRILDAALFNLCQGAKPSLFFEAPRPDGIGKPTNLFENMPRAQLAVILDLLIKTKMRKAEAIKWVLTECRRQKLKLDAKSVSDWRAEISERRAPALMRQAFIGLMEDYRLSDAALPLEEIFERARVEAYGVASIAGLARKGF